MQDSNHWTTFYDAFFAEHPEWLADVRYERLKGSNRPEMLMSTAGMRAFLQWVQSNPLLRYNRREFTVLLAACRREHHSLLSGPTFAPKLAEIRA